jgi:outer membrane protein assembly factor BamB
VYAYFGSYGLIAFDHDGNQQWTLPLPVVKVPYGSGTSPVLAGDRLIISRDEGSTPYLLAVEKDTGKVAWKQPQYGVPVGARTFNASTPCIWKDEIVVHHRNEVAGFALVTGARKWWVNISTQGTGSPACGPDAVYAPTWFNDGEPELRVPLPGFDDLLKRADKNGDGVVSREEFPDSFTTTHRIDLDAVRGATQNIPGSDLFQYADQNHDGKVERSEWERLLESFKPSSREHGLVAIRPGGTGNVPPRNILWKEPRGVPEVPTPLVYKDRVYTVTNGGTVSCMNATTGQLVFRERLGIPGGYFASPIAAGVRIYFASNEGTITVIAAGDQFRVLARNQVGEPLFATAAIVENSIYVRTTSSLYSFGDK